MLLFAGVLIMAHATGLHVAWRWAWTYLALAAGIPLLYFVHLYRRGDVSDFDISDRSERLRPMLITLGCMAVGGAVLWLGGAPRLESTWVTVIWVELALVWAITQRWKISVHGAAAAATVTMLWTIFGPVALLATPIVLMVAWSRVHLLRHTPAQTVAGALLGSVTGFAMLRLLAGM
jgi:membrane-associated phospholipid phosphatase